MARKRNPRRYEAVLQYSFKCCGHPNIRAKHEKTIEFTRDGEIGIKADCILGVKADFRVPELVKLDGEVLLTVEVAGLMDEFHAFVNPDFNDERELVLRKSRYSTPRTFGFALSKGARGLDRGIARLMRDPGREMIVTVYQKPVRKIVMPEQDSILRTRGSKLIEIGRDELDALISGYDKAVLDIGAGSGKFIYQLARRNPRSFCIGLETSHDSLLDYARRIEKKPSRGGLGNVLYIIASIDSPGEQLLGIADEIYINYPWTNLLRSLVRGEGSLLARISSLFRGEGRLEMTISYDKRYEPAFVAEHGLPELTEAYIRDTMVPAYVRCGYNLEGLEVLGSDEMRRSMSGWGKRLAFSRDRTLYRIRMVRKCRSPSCDHRLVQ